MELFECSGSLEPDPERESSRRESERPFLLGESASPFIGEGDGLKNQRKREWIRVLPSLVAHAAGYETVVGVHNTVYVRRMW